jgi:predicted transcriptional regulator of viral defense system
MIATREAVAELADAGLDLFTIGDLQERLGVTRPQARDLAFRMQRRGLVTRIKRGLYALIPMGDWIRTPSVPVNWFAAAAAVAAPDPYFVAYYSAFEIHGLTQHPLRTVFVAMARQKPNLDVGRVRFRFVTLSKERFFGKVEKRLEGGRPIFVADLVRTVIDGVDRPDLCGGLGEVIGALTRARDSIDADKLVRYIVRFDSPVLTKRLGFLLEMTRAVDPELLWELERISGRIGHYVPLEKGSPLAGATRSKRWEIDVNIDLPELLRATRT